MLVAIHKDRYDRFDPFCEIYEKILAFNNIPSIRVDINDADFWRGKYDELLKHLEHQNKYLKFLEGEVFGGSPF